MSNAVDAPLFNLVRELRQIIITVRQHSNTKTGLASMVVIISIAFMSANIKTAPETRSNEEFDGFSDRLYNNVIIADYRSAVAQTVELENNLRGDVIELVANKLLAEANRNTMDYAYRLWNCGLEEIVIKYFPLQIRLLIDNRTIKIINMRDGLAIKLASNKDQDGDRQSYGDGHDKTSLKISWKMFPVWEKNRVYFKILNVHHNQYLKLELAKNSAGDHKAFGATRDDTYRHQWYLQPVKHEGDILLYIYSREYSQALKLDRTVDREGNRMLWSHNGNFIENPALYGWKILPL